VRKLLHLPAQRKSFDRLVLQRAIQLCGNDWKRKGVSYESKLATDFFILTAVAFNDVRLAFRANKR